MKIVVAMDSFKGSLTSSEAGNAARNGILKALELDKSESHEVVVFPLADGGEGTVEAITAKDGGDFETINVAGPLGDDTSFIYGILKDGTIVMEMAQAAGLTLIPQDRLNPLKTSTYGLGQAIASIVKGANGKKLKFLIGIGGSATNDCGTGMLQALGYRFLDESGNELKGNGGNLDKIVEINGDNVIPGLDKCKFEIASDVMNVLYGEEGAAYVYAKQKGADDDMIEQLDEGMHNFADVVFWYNATYETQTEGAGAAGGLGYAFLSFFPGQVTFSSGADLVMEANKIKEELMQGVDLMVTGEGCLDAQTVNGKGPMKAAAMAKTNDVPIVAIAGMMEEDFKVLHDAGISACFSIMDHPCSANDAMQKDFAIAGVERTAEQVMRTILMGRSLAK